MTAHTCPCCGDITYAGAGPLCTECILAGCELTADATGELGWWNCQREDAEPAEGDTDAACAPGRLAEEGST
jgi:hypothetical protein